MESNSKAYKDFVDDIRRTVGAGRIYTDELRRLAWGTDAGFYRLLPQVVVRVENEAEVTAVLGAASKCGVPVTFRAAGTSLSGQAITDSVLVVAGKAWEKYRILDDKAEEIELEPGIVGARVDEILRPYGRMFAPDPASKKSAMVGGIVMNNASGMSCGTHANSDRILRSMRIILADGTVLDTGDEASRRDFERSHPALLAELTAIRDAVKADPELTALIDRKYSIKNVTGLNLRPFTAYDDVFDILAHCMVGSEGTLGFMSKVRVSTAPIQPFSASAMVYFKTIDEASRAVVALRKGAPVDACELLDSKSLASVNDTTGEGLTALLIQVTALSEQQLGEKMAAVTAVLSGYDLFSPAHFETDPKTVSEYWQVRSGIFPAVGGTRRPGTTVLIEDIAFPIEELPEATVKLQKILTDCHYDDACIYGHALEGNFHFIISQAFDTPEEIARYKDLMERIVTLVVDEHHGSLKAEHGTGRNMAPFVEHEWGTKAWELMKRIKKAFDPEGLLNPGVIFNDDPECYIHCLKPLPLTNPHVDRCIECGFCEVNCVSCGLTLSARQRIVSCREIARLTADGSDPERLKALEDGFRYYGNETCAGDGLCSTSCPMSINTSELIHDIRQAALGPTGHRIGAAAAHHLGGVTAGLRIALGCAQAAHAVIGDKGVTAVGKGLHRLGMPLWTPALPVPFNGNRLPDRFPADGSRPRKVVYFPSCINRTMGRSEEADRHVRPLPEVFVSLCRKAGFDVVFPKNMSKLCCGMIWESKGMPDTADEKTAELEAALLEASEGGALPVVCDQSPCMHRMQKGFRTLKVHEISEFIYNFLAPHLKFHRHDIPVALHITCSSRLMKLNSTIIALAQKCSTNVLVPEEVGCCGFAGDRGFTHPELNAWGLRKLKPQLEAAGIKYGYSNSRTCEIGLTANSGIPYKSIAYLVDECTTPAK